MASKPTEMCVVETTGAREYKVRVYASSSFFFIFVFLSLEKESASAVEIG